MSKRALELVRQLKHLPGKHPQKSHGSGSGSGTMYGVHTQAAVDEALNWIAKATLSSKGTTSLSHEAEAFLSETVDPAKNYKLYRGIGIIRQRIDEANRAELNNLKPGDAVPDFLNRQVAEIASYSKKKSVANYYAEGSMSVVAMTTDKNRIVADLENLPKVLSKYGINSKFDESDIDYWKSDKEVFVKEPASSVIVSVKGRI